MLRGVVFDMDGVVIDSHPAHRAAWKAFLGAVGKPVLDSDLDIILDGGKREEILKHFLGDLSPQQIEQYGSLKDEILRNRTTRLEPITGVIEFLNELCNSSVRVALATSASRQRTLDTLNELQLTHYFEAIVTGDDVAAGKPDPFIYQLAASRMQELPEHLLAVEDAVSGVKAARSAGLRCAAIANNGRAHSLRAAGANPIVADFRSLSITEIRALFP